MSLYEIRFKTWENDGDDYDTVNRFVTTKEDVNFYLALANQFVSTNRSGLSGLGNLGNDSYDDETLEEVVQETIEEHPHISETLKNEWLAVIGKPNKTYYKLCDEILSYPVQYEEYGFCRVLEKTEVNEMSLGTWINVNHTIGVFQGYEKNHLIYYYSMHERNEKNEIDIFKIEWKRATCKLNEFSKQSEPDEISLKLIEFFKV